MVGHSDPAVRQKVSVLLWGLHGPHAALQVWRPLVTGLCTVGYDAGSLGAWLGVVQRVLLVRWVLRLGVLFGVHSRCQWWLLVCGTGGDAGCGAGSVGAPGAPLGRVGACY